MRIEAVELVRCQVPFVSPFRTSYGVRSGRDVVLVRVLGEGLEGWGEDVAEEAPLYSAEFVEASLLALRHHLVPRLLAAGEVGAHDVARVLAPVRGWEMAKAALEIAVLDADLQRLGMSMAQWLGGTRRRIPAGVAVGIHDTIDHTVAAALTYVAQGYMRIKLKIEPGRDIDLVRAVRAAIGPDVMLHVDANAAYTLADAAHLRRLDAYDLLMIEQPLPEHELGQHAELAALIDTPICLDETITSASVAAQALAMGACAVINIKPGRVGGLLEARRIHDLCQAQGVAVWCGGMLETGIGRAANLALASLPGFTLPPDLSASSRYFVQDLTEPFELVDGHLEVPTGPGLGVAPLDGALRAAGASREVFGT
jgi:o-succinylbenzoate synthase